WMTCQSVARPSSAEYWHMGAMTIRLRRSSEPTRYGLNNVLAAMPCLGVGAVVSVMAGRGHSVSLAATSAHAWVSGSGRGWPEPDATSAPPSRDQLAIPARGGPRPA